MKFSSYQKETRSDKSLCWLGIKIISNYQMNLNIPMLNDNRIDIDPKEKECNSREREREIFEFTSVWTSAGRCVRSNFTVWNTSTTPSYRIRSRTILNVRNTPVLPTPVTPKVHFYRLSKDDRLPAEQWTTIGPSWPKPSFVLCTCPMKSINPSPTLGTPCSGHSVYRKWRIVRDCPSWKITLRKTTLVHSTSLTRVSVSLNSLNRYCCIWYSPEGSIIKYPERIDWSTGQYWAHLSLPISFNFVSITIIVTLCSHIIRQKSSIVSFNGPWVAI